MSKIDFTLDSVTNRFAYETTRLDLEEALEAAVDKTLGEVDVAHVFDKTQTNPKITGIAGDVIEQSVLRYPPNNHQEPDLIVDGEQVELKTTGLRKAKKKSGFEAKEPMSITAVSLDKIAAEDFESSAFFHKIRKMLIVYYLYDSESTVTAAEYAKFPIKGYQFHEFSEDELAILKNDWQIVHDFIERIQTEHPNEEERRLLYPHLSSALRHELMFIDTAPKYPNPPRFRLKRSVVTTMARKLFGNSFERLPQAYLTFSAIDQKLHELAKANEGKNVKRLGLEYGIDELSAKNIAEEVIVRMFGGHGKMSDIELFSEIGLQAKSVTLTKTGARTEDIKFSPSIDFDDLANPNQSFENSLLYSQFANTQYLFVVFEEPSHSAPLEKNTLRGFKRLNFDEDFIQKEVRPIWDEMRRLIFENKLVFVPEIDKKTGLPIINKTGVIKGAPNFPKSKDSVVFVRGSGSDSTKKPLCINGVWMYCQNIWVKGSYVVKRLEELDWL